MRLLSILPIARGIRKETLTYFSTEDIPLGALVAIPLRSRTVQGIIIESKDAMEAKAEIKGMDFTVKKIQRHKGDAGIPVPVMEAARKVAEICATSVGAVLSAMVPKVCLEFPELFFTAKESPKTKGTFETLAMQSESSDRYDTYKSIIRESFAKKLSIAVICPTESSGEAMANILSKGIADYTLRLPETTSKKILSTWYKKVHESNHPLLLIGGAQLLALLPLATGTIILEEESSQFYKSRRQPYLDTRQVVREVARAAGSRIIYGDKLLSVETHAKIKEGKTQEYSRISKRSTYKIQTLLVDTKPKEDEKKVFKALSPDLEEMIRYSDKGSKKLFIYSPRRGLASQTVCRDCGTTVLCAECESPVVLHGKTSETEDTRRFICHHCGKARGAHEKCSVCESWNLVPYGIGIERIEEEIAKITDTEIIRVDSDTARTPKEAKTKINRFLEIDKAKKTPKILLGTDLALRHLPDLSVDFAAIPTLESIHSLPDFRTSERVMHALLDVKGKATECLLVQSRDPKQSVIEQGLAGDLESFVRDEIKARKAFGYPPYMRLIKLTVGGKKDKVKQDSAVVAERLAKWNPRIFPAFIKSIKGQTLLHILMKIPESQWPDKELTGVLLSLPPSVKIDSSPASLL